MTSTISRRDFLVRSTALASGLAVAPRFIRSFTFSRDVVAEDNFAIVQRLADGIWAVISTPKAGNVSSRATLCNGGIIAGKDAVLVIEGFYTPAGATWVAGQCKALTGRAPTHVALTHFHEDHTDGVAAYFTGGAKPVLRSTEVTKDWTLTKNPADADRAAAMNQVTLLSGTENTTLDLGGKKVKVVPRSGHTESDISLELDDQNIVFCGDLFWNNLLPNYINAIPTMLAQSVRALRHDDKTTYVPGHGGLGTQADYDKYVSLVDELERAARDGHQRGLSADSLSASYKVPDSFGVNAGRRGLQSVFNAWYKELDAK